LDGGHDDPGERRIIMRRPSHGTVVAYLALFIALGGTTLAATHLGKSSVGANQLKKNSVVTAKVKNKAITTAKIADDAGTGAQLNESTLGQVPNAASASSAANAEAVDGMHVGRIDYRADAGTPETTVFSADGLVLHASCSASKNLEFTATTSVD